MNSRAFAQLLFLGAIWGAAFMFMRIAVPEFGAIALAGTRVALACALMIAIVLVLREPSHFKTHWKKYLFVGGVNTAIPFIAYCFAALYIPSGYSAIANSTTPIWGALIAWLWFKEPLGALKWLGIVFAFAGVVALVGLQPVAVTPMVIISMLAVLFAAAMYATASFLIRRYLQDIPGLVGATGMVWGATVWLVLPALFAAPKAMPSWNAWGSVLALAVLCTAIGYLLFFRLIAKIGPQRASSVAFLFPAFAAFWGWLFLDEPITANMLIGMALVLAGTALVSAPSSWLTECVSNFRTFRDTIALPILVGVSSPALRRWLVRYAVSRLKLYEHETRATSQAITRTLPGLETAQLERDYRFDRLADLSDFWISRLRWSPHRIPKIDTMNLDEIDPKALWVTYHFGAGWWITSFLHERGLSANLLIRKPGIAVRWMDRLAMRIGLYRNEHFARLVGAPLIWSNESNAALKMRGAWREGRSVIALSDLPAEAGDRAQNVPFFGRDARFPSAVFSLAAAAKVPVYLFLGRWNTETCNPELSIELLAKAGLSASETMRRYVERMEQEIRARPAAWHVWPSFDTYFVKSASIEHD
jgi:drug/metabolite transporter (DMT)-like permease